MVCDAKCENLQKIGAFKYRGALNAVKKYQEQHSGEDTPTFVTHSSGNHAQVYESWLNCRDGAFVRERLCDACFQAVALAAKDTNARAIIVMVG